MNAHRLLIRPALPLLALALSACVSGQPAARSTKLHPLPRATEATSPTPPDGRAGRAREAARVEATNREVVTTRIEDLFTGRYAGLDVYRDGNGQIVMRLRGVEPLLIIDGLEADADILGAIPPGQVRSVEVFRSGPDTAIYGSRGVNGVVRVTTDR